MVMYNCKIILLGQGSVGKTSVIRRFVEQAFSHDYKTTVGSNFLLKKLTLDEDTRMTMQIWDLSGQDSFRNIRTQYFLHSHGGIMVFDLTRPETLTDLDRWHLDFTQKAGDVPLMLFGNKCDLVNERLVQSEAGEISAEKYNATYLETSALDGTNVQEAFTELAEQIIAHIEKRRSSISRTY
ncbi:MAG: Rab family GTPase [Candidatus Hodarchaeales archaeon]|jgi:small GTP-binding protein